MWLARTASFVSVEVAMQRRWPVLVGAGSLSATAIFQVCAGFVAVPTVWQVVTLLLSGIFALVAGVLSFAGVDVDMVQKTLRL